MHIRKKKPERYAAAAAASAAAAERDLAAALAVLFSVFRAISYEHLPLRLGVRKRLDHDTEKRFGREHGDKRAYDYDGDDDDDITTERLVWAKSQ